MCGMPSGGHQERVHTAPIRAAFRNFGKLAHADIRVGAFTVFAGPNNTGKSFASKLLYSTFHALNADLPQERVFRLVSLLRLDARRLFYDEDPPLVKESQKIVSQMEDVAFSYRKGEIQDLDHVASTLLQHYDQLRKLPIAEGRRLEGSLLKPIDQFSQELSRAKDQRTFTSDEFTHRFQQNLIRNFQVPNVRDLRGDTDDRLEVNIDRIVRFRDSDMDGAMVELGKTASSILSDTTNIVYLESPIYWKLFEPLRQVGQARYFRSRPRRTLLTGVPGYFYDLAEDLIYEYSDEIAYPEVYRWLNEEVIGGRVAVSERGEMSFEEGGRSYPLYTAATGVANIGMLAMLIERKAIDRGTMLFIDEPEAHLHTAWQGFMAEALFRLAKGGVKVVIATHSVDILKWLEVHLREHPDDTHLVALNQFPNPGSEETDLALQLATIKEDLARPFFDLFLRGM